MKTTCFKVLGLGLVLALTNTLGSSTAEAGTTHLNQLTCQAVNTLGTAGIGLSTKGEVLIQTTSVLGARNDQYTVGNITRTLEKSKGSHVHLISTDEKTAGVLLKFSKEIPDGLTRLEGYLYSVRPTFNPTEEQAPAAPVAYVTCTLEVVHH